jgi:DNA modification methylase
MSCFYKGDVKTILPTLQSKSINLIYFDPPFGTTKNFWDESLDWSFIFKECFRILKDDGMLIIHCSIPFNYELIRAAPKPPSHSWYWLKDSHTNPLLSKIQPLRQVEEILVWKNKKGVYYPQKMGEDLQRSTYMTKSDYFGKDKKNTITYNKGKFRNHFVQMKRKLDGFSTRPDELVKLMIESYSKDGDTILDLFCYKGISYKCKGNRRWLGVDKYFFPSYFLS